MIGSKTKRFAISFFVINQLGTLQIIIDLTKIYKNIQGSSQFQQEDQREVNDAATFAK